MLKRLLIPFFLIVPVAALSQPPLSSHPRRNCVRQCMGDSTFLWGTVGSGTTCAAARGDASQKIRNLANARCVQRWGQNAQLCLLSEEYPPPCIEVSPGLFQVEVDAIYTCSDLFFC